MAEFKIVVSDPKIGKSINKEIKDKEISESKNNTRILIKKSKYALDQDPIMKDCPCYTCKNYTKSYLHYLFKTKSPAYYPLACEHNISVMQQACLHMQRVIIESSATSTPPS